MHGAPAARENVFRLLHKLPQNDCFESWTIKISWLSLQKKLVHEKYSHFERTARPWRTLGKNGHVDSDQIYFIVFLMFFCRFAEVC